MSCTLKAWVDFTGNIFALDGGLTRGQLKCIPEESSSRCILRGEREKGKRKRIMCSFEVRIFLCCYFSLYLSSSSAL